MRISTETLSSILLIPSRWKDEIILSNHIKAARVFKSTTTYWLIQFSLKVSPPSALPLLICHNFSWPLIQFNVFSRDLNKIISGLIAQHVWNIYKIDRHSKFPLFTWFENWVVEFLLFRKYKLRLIAQQVLNIYQNLGKQSWFFFLLT